MYAASLKLLVGMGSGNFTAQQNSLQPYATVVIARQIVHRHAQLAVHSQRQLILLFTFRVVVDIARMEHEFNRRGKRVNLAYQGFSAWERGTAFRPFPAGVSHYVRIADVDEGQGLHSALTLPKAQLPRRFHRRSTASASLHMHLLHQQD